MLTTGEASIEKRQIKVVIWTTKDKITKPYLFNKDTTIQDIIDDILAAEAPGGTDDQNMKNDVCMAVCMALLGHIEHPFELLACDLPQQLVQGESNSTNCLGNSITSHVSDGCTAKDFSVKVFDLIMATPDNIMGLEDFISSCVQPVFIRQDLESPKETVHEIKNKDDRLKAVDKAKEMFWDVEHFENYGIHLFMYNHQEVDLCNIEGGEDGKWSKKDWKLTTNESSLWLQLEKEFLTKKMDRDLYDWTEATIIT
jgi:hypothetical protein